MKEIVKIKQCISAIQNNYPPASYTLLREALDYCLELLKEKEMELSKAEIEDLID